MQQGRGGTGSQYGEMTPAATATATAHMVQQPVEPASPISSRPPATSVTSNLDELMRLSGGGDEDEGDRAGGVASGSRWPRQETLALLKIRSDMDAAFRDATVKGPLWDDVSRKLAELGYKRSAKKCKEKFENVHKYYKRTKEGRAGRQDGKSYKFFSQLEALHSSTPTTSNVSASLPMPVTTVTSSNTNTINLDVAPVSIGVPMPISSVRIPTSHSPSTLGVSSSMFPPDISTTIPAAANIPGSAPTPPAPHRTTTTTNNPIGISFSSNSSSSSPETEDDDDDDDDDDDEMDFEEQPSNTAGGSRKRKRQSSTTTSSSTHRMMKFFEGLMKQVMQKQEAMQQRFLEVIQKREQERMIREEACKRQEMARLAREHELMAQERAISTSRDAAIITFLQNITGQTIQLPPAVTIPAAPPPTAPPQAAPVVVLPAVPLPTPTQHLTPSPIAQERRDQQNQQQTQSHHRYQQQQQVKSAEVVRYQPASTSLPSEVVMAIPEQQIPPSQEISSGGSFEPSSSRWPKVEVLALIKLRSGLEPRYQEAGPKGPLWEEISAGMQRMGYNRSAKRCKEKWENINKYFKKVKESNKKRPEDAKTCPYFHELDALYRKKILGSGSTSGGGGGGTSTSSFNISEERQSQQHQQESHKIDPIPTPATNPQEGSNVETIMPASQLTPASELENKNVGNVDAQVSNVGLPGSLFGEGNGGASNEPEDIVKELMNPQGMQQQLQQHQHPQPSIVNDFDKIEESNMGSDSDNMDHEEDYDEDEDEGEELEEERKMAYKVEFQRQNTNTSNGGGNGAASFLAMVQ